MAKSAKGQEQLPKRFCPINERVRLKYIKKIMTKSGEKIMKRWDTVCDKIKRLKKEKSFLKKKYQKIQEGK